MTRTLGELCDVGDGTHAKITRQAFGVPYLSARNLKDGRLDLSKVYFISEADYEKHFAHSARAVTRPKAGDLLFSIIGSIGSPYFVKEEDRFGLSSSIAIVRPKSAELVPKFLHYWTLGPAFQAAVRGTRGGVAQGYLSLAMIRSLPAPSISRSAQERAVSVLSAYDDLIEVNQRRIAILEEMARRLFEEWFVRFRYPGGNGSRPESWLNCRLGDVVENFDRLRKPLSGIQRSTMRGVHPYYGAAKVFDYIDQYIFDGTYLLVAEDGSVEDADGAPLRQLVRGKFWPNNHVHVLRAKPPFSNEFVFLALGLLTARPYVTGAAQPKITQANLNAMPIIRASDCAHAAFNGQVAPMFALRQNLVGQCERLRAARDLLLPKLISSDIEVDAAPTPNDIGRDAA